MPTAYIITSDNPERKPRVFVDKAAACRALYAIDPTSQVWQFRVKIFDKSGNVFDWQGWHCYKVPVER